MRAQSQPNSGSVPLPGGEPEASAAVRELDHRNWEVEIRIDGERVLTIGHDHLSGVYDIDRFGDTVRLCADHLRAFIGSGEPEPCFACGGSEQERCMGLTGEEIGPCSVCRPDASPAERQPQPRDDLK